MIYNYKNNLGKLIMSPTEILALLKYAWATFIPVIYKLWGSINNRFKEIDGQVAVLRKDQSEIKTNVRVLIERLDNQEKMFNMRFTRQEKDMKELLNLFRSKYN